MRSRALQVYHNAQSDFVSGELLAYASKSVCNLVEKLERML
jgi:hypothetical protein